LLNPDKQSATSKKHPPAVFDVAIAILEYQLSKGEIDKAIDYLNTHPVGSRPNWFSHRLRQRRTEDIGIMSKHLVND